MLKSITCRFIYECRIISLNKLTSNLLVIFFVMITGCYQRTSDSDKSKSGTETIPTNGEKTVKGRLIVEPEVINFGLVEGGHRVEARMGLMNSGPAECYIFTIQTSCPCLTVEPPTVKIMPGQRTQLCVVLDLRSEPEFRGNLAIDIEGKSVEGSALIAARAEVTVHEPDSGGLHGSDRTK